MNKVKCRVFNEEIIENIFWEDHPDYELIKEGDWISEGKVEYQSRIFKDKEGLFWRVNADRSGSHFTDWHYTYGVGMIRVKEKEVTVTKWVPIDE